MLKAFLVLAVITALVLVGSYLFAQTTKQVTFEWDDPNTVDAGVTEYVLYESTVGSNPATDPFAEKQRIPVGSLTANSTLNLDSGKHWFYVTAVNWAGESGPSNVVLLNTNRPAVVNFKIK